MSSLELSAEVLFDDLSRRPTTDQMSQLIEAGATEKDVVSAGLECGLPDHAVEVARTEIQTLLPNVHDLSDTIHNDKPYGANDIVVCWPRCRSLVR